MVPGNGRGEAGSRWGRAPCPSDKAGATQFIKKDMVFEKEDTCILQVERDNKNKRVHTHTYTQKTLFRLNSV